MSTMALLERPDTETAVPALVSRPFELLDLDDTDERDAYERAFYSAFTRVPENRLVRALWRWDDDAGRLATRVPYADQRIYVRRSEGVIDGGIAVNVRLAQFQAAQYGFAPPAERAGRCEFLTFFSAAERRLATKQRFRRACLADLLRRGFHTGYTTVGPRMYHAYRRLNFGTLLDQAELNGEQRFFLAVDIAKEAGAAD
jgi:hypothetical protein